MASAARFDLDDGPLGGVGFVEYDDITGHSYEIEVVANVIVQTGRDMALSLSPGGVSVLEFVNSYRQADLLSIIRDTWDKEESIRRSFNAGSFGSRYAESRFWINLVMISFGDLQAMSPHPNNKDELDEANPELCGKGWRRRCRLSLNYRRGIMVLHALSCMLLFVGGDLTMLAAKDLELLTHPRLLVCNRIGVFGTIIYMSGDSQVGKAECRTMLGADWLGDFNCNSESGRAGSIQLSHTGLPLSPLKRLHNAWKKQVAGNASLRSSLWLIPGGVVFIEYEGGSDQGGLPILPAFIVDPDYQ